MKKLSIILWLVLAPLMTWAQTTMTDLFKSMPDSLLPCLSENNRLDMIDYRQANMKAEVTNLLGNTSEMTLLAPDSLSIRMSESMQVDMVLIHTEEEYDSCHQVIALLKTYFMADKPVERTAHFYSLRWMPLGPLPQYASRYTYSLWLRRDDQINKNITL